MIRVSKFSGIYGNAGTYMYGNAKKVSGVLQSVHEHFKNVCCTLFHDTFLIHV